MRRVKLLKDCKQGKAGETITLDNNEAWGLVESGLGEITKDMKISDYKVKSNPDDLDKQEKTDGFAT